MKSILVIDDSVDSLDLVDRILSFAGYDVCKASCPEQAFKILLNEPFDLIICDLHMPFTVDESHFDFQYSYEVGLRTIKELEWALPGTPIIAISATTPWDLPGVMSAIAHIPALSKPFSPRTLMQLVQAALYKEEGLVMH